jgi:hypothetical protein
MKEGGFVGPSFVKWVYRCRTVHARPFGLAMDVNNYAHRILEETVANRHASKSDQERLVLAMFLRSVELFQGIILLAERGMVAEVSVLIRTLLEIEIRLAFAAKSEEYAAQLILNGEFDRRKSLKAALTVPNGLTDTQRAQFEAAVKRLDGKLTGKKRSLHSLEDQARRAGQSDLYSLMYRGFSGPVHSSPRDLQQHAIISQDRKGIHFRLGPEFETVPFFLSMALFAYIKLLTLVTTVVGCEAEQVLKEFNSRLKSLKPAVKAPPWW